MTSPRIILLVLQWNLAGGLERVTVEIAHALRRTGARLEVWSVFDHKPVELNGITSIPMAPANRVLRSAYGRGLCWRHVAKRLKQASDCRLLVLGHAHLLPLLQHVSTAPATWLWTYGIEAWGEPGRRNLANAEQVDRLISVSRFTAGELPVPATVLYPPIDADYFTPLHDPSPIRRNEILICGRMASNERYKGHDILFDAVALARSRYDASWTLRVTGDGDDRDRLERRARDVLPEDAVRFTGRLPADELRDAYRSCGVFAMPSAVVRNPRGMWGGEGLGLVYLEAAACGRPVIAGRDGGSAETIEPGVTGLLVDARSSDELAAALRSILDDPARADAMGAAGRRLVESRFTRAVFDREIQKLLREDTS